MMYLLLDKNLNIIKKLSTRELKKFVNDYSYNSIKEFMLDTCGIFNGMYIIEDSLEFDAQNFKFICDSERYRYFASSNGEFYSVSKVSNKRKIIRKYYHKGEVRVCIAGKLYNAARLIAKLFLSDYSEDKYALINGDDKFDISVQNLKMVTKSQFYKKIKDSRKNSCKIGLFENGECIKEFDSIVDTSRELHYSYANIRYHLKRETNLDVRYI